VTLPQQVHRAAAAAAATAAAAKIIRRYGQVMLRYFERHLLIATRVISDRNRCRLSYL